MDNKKIIWKRIIAYAIDVFLITMIVSMLSSVKVLNPKIDNYNKDYKEYITLTQKYQDKKISKKKYNIKYNKIYYRLQKNAVYYNGMFIIAIILYFGVFQTITKGQTIGKKLMKIQTVTKDGKDVTFKECIIRSLFLYNTIYYFLLTLGIYIFKSNNYSIYSNGLYYANMILELIIIYLVFTKEDMRGLHDMIANTKVISLDKEEKVIIDAEYIEIDNKKITSKKTSKAKNIKEKKKIDK